jgi:acyl-coenzyme A synthetase/AMP-(fatty) acid ligase
VDEVLFAHDQVEQAATVGIEQGAGSTVTTWIVMRRGTFEDGPDEGRMPANEAQLDEKRDEIAEFLAQRLDRRKRPTAIMFARKLPADTTGKTRIIELKQLSNRKAVPPKKDSSDEE